MTLQRFDPLHPSLAAPHRRQVRSQYAALCYRMVKGRCQVLLVTTRGKGRWIVPRGWPMDGFTPAETALQEAYEEAGVIGRAHPNCLGVYTYMKSGVPCVVAVYAVAVKRLAREYRETGERRRQWCAIPQAIQLVDEPELRSILASFRPDALPRPHHPRHRRS
ncbi:MAG: NUDIX hydrolase [Pseudomonadota bacterium]